VSTSSFDLRPFAVVTGGSSGIGYELANQFLLHHFDVLIVADGASVADAAEALSHNGMKVEALQADLATPDGVELLFERIQASGRPLDSIAINAGVGLNGPFAESDIEEQFKLLHLNVMSPVHLARLVLPGMISRRHGRILITSSIAGVMPGPFEATYNASKAFLKSFAEAIRNEVQDSGITVTTLMPGATATSFFERAGAMDTKVGTGDKDDAAEVARQGYEALMSGEDHVVAGSFMNKVQAAASHVLPDPTLAKIYRGKTEPGSAKK
jgi:short-subunit dehydrogenase